MADFHMNRTSITPWFSVSACSQFTFIFSTMILLRTLPGSEMKWPKIFPKHPQIIQNILLQVKCSPPRWRQVLSQPDRASVDVGTLEASVSSCQVQFLTAMSNTSKNICWPATIAQRCPEMYDQGQIPCLRLWNRCHQMYALTNCLN